MTFFDYIMNITTFITATSALLTVFYLWYDRRARIVVSIELLDRAYYITIENVGRSVARNVKISIDTDYIMSLPVYHEEGYRPKEILLNIQNRKFYYTPGTKKYYYLIQCPKKNTPLSHFDKLCNDWHDRFKFTPFRIYITYNNWLDLSEEFFLEQFHTEALLYKDSISKISDSLKKMEENQKRCNSMLSALARSIKECINGKNENAK